MNYLDQIERIETTTELLNSIRKEKGLHPKDSYKLGFLKTLMQGFDDRADIENILKAIDEMRKEFSLLHKLMLIEDYESSNEITDEDASTLKEL
jgi:hypothetical protein